MCWQHVKQDVNMCFIYRPLLHCTAHWSCQSLYEKQRSWSWIELKCLTHSCLFIKVICDPVYPKILGFSIVCLLCVSACKGPCSDLRDHLVLFGSCTDKSEPDLLLAEASSSGEAGEERFVRPLVCREQPSRTKTSVITVNLRQCSMAANRAGTIQARPNNGK